MLARSVIFAVVALSAAAAQQASAPARTEQIETGTAPCQGQRPDNVVREGMVPGPVMCHYRIRLLPVSSFPQLPAIVAQQLDEKGCMIPQTYEAHEPENVIHGSFEKQESSDWAVLCSISRVTTLYVFFQSNLANPIALRHQPDTEWLGVEWSLDYGSAWGIATRPARLMPVTMRADHAGIDDSFVEKSTTVHYFNNGQWTTIDLGE